MRGSCQVAEVLLRAGAEGSPEAISAAAAAHAVFQQERRQAEAEEAALQQIRQQQASEAALKKAADAESRFSSFAHCSLILLFS
jgi:hypothetical protein